MQVVGSELLMAEPCHVKFLLNERAIAFFPLAQQHRAFKSHGLTYEDDYRGNAVAGIVAPQRIEIRYHSSFSPQRVSQLWSQVLAAPEFAGLNFGALHYQGKALT